MTDLMEKLVETDFKNQFKPHSKEELDKRHEALDEDELREVARDMFFGLEDSSAQDRLYSKWAPQSEEGEGFHEKVYIMIGMFDEKELRSFISEMMRGLGR